MNKINDNNNNNDNKIKTNDFQEVKNEVKRKIRIPPSIKTDKIIFFKKNTFDQFQIQYITYN